MAVDSTLLYDCLKQAQAVSVQFNLAADAAIKKIHLKFKNIFVEIDFKNNIRKCY